MIPAGQYWHYYPQLEMARNVHNGNWAVCGRRVVWCYNVPSRHMLEDLAHWLGLYRTFC